MVLSVGAASGSCSDVHEAADQRPAELAGMDQSEPNEGTGAHALPQQHNPARPASAASTSDADGGFAPGPAPTVPESWKRVTGAFGISMRAPTLVATATQCGSDSCLARFEGPGCSYVVERGGFSDSLASRTAPSYDSEDVLVDGKSGRLVQSLGPVDDGYFVGLHLFQTGAGVRGATLGLATVNAVCSTPQAVQTARLVVQTLALPADEQAASAPLSPMTDCAGEDIRPIMGYRLGTPCAGGKLTVPGICALGARANGSFGTGPMTCFVTSVGDYYWGFAAYGEIVAGPGTRHGRGPHQASELSVAEEFRCQMLVDLLGMGENTGFGEYVYPSCP
jgi:hypothetical protein